MNGKERAAIMARVRGISRQMIAGADEAALEVAHEAAQDAAGRAPVDSGKLRDSFLGGPDGIGPGGVRRDPGPDSHDRQTFTIGSARDYASEIEHTDTPMLRPAVNERGDELQRRTMAAIRRRLR